MTRGISMAGALVLALAGAVPAARGALASDNADNEPYVSDATFMPGQNGGSGFASWVDLEVGTPGSMYLEELNPLDGNQSWGVSGTYALGRGLDAALAEATWSFSCTYGDGIDGFCGFNLRTSTDVDDFATGEIFRFGLNYGEEYDATGIYYSTDAGSSYEVLDLGNSDLRGMLLEYDMTWSTLLGSFTLGVYNADEDVYAEIGGSLSAGSPVAMLGAGIFEATLDERMTFDDYRLSAIPEPGSAALFGLGAFGLWAVRRRRSRSSRRD